MRRKIFKISIFIIFLLLFSGCVPRRLQDIIPPQVSIIYPQDGQQVSGSITIKVDASDNVKVVKVEFYIDGVKKGEDYSSPYEYLWDTREVSNGIHTITAVAYDNAGNSGCASINVNVQNIQQNIWQKIYGGSYLDFARSIQKTEDGGYIIAGGTFSSGSGSCDVYIIKLKSNGEKEWERTYGGSSYDCAYSIEKTSDGGYIVVGKTNSFGGNYNFYIIKLKSNGEKEWEKNYGGSYEDCAYSVQETSDGYIVAGYKGTSEGFFDVYIIKLKSNGEKDWEKTFGGIYNDVAYCIRRTSDGGYIVAGETWPLGAEYAEDYDIYIIKLYSNGNEEWSRIYGDGGKSYDCAYSIQETSNGYIVAGYTEPSEGNYDVYIIKLKSNGDVDWEKTFGGIYNDVACCIQKTSDGGYIVAGYTGYKGIDAYILKLDSDGNKVWERNYGGDYEDYAYSVQETSDGYIVAGLTYLSATNADVYIIKTDLEGNTGPYPLP